MQRTEIRNRLQHIFEEETDTKLGEFRDSMVLAQDFTLDSVDYMSLIMHVEESFHIRMSNEDLTSLVTIGELVDKVQAKLAMPTQSLRRAA
jgi:acyl carrier protein